MDSYARMMPMMMMKVPVEYKPVVEADTVDAVDADADPDDANDPDCFVEES